MIAVSVHIVVRGVAIRFVSQPQQKDPDVSRACHLALQSYDE